MLIIQCCDTLHVTVIVDLFSDTASEGPIYKLVCHLVHKDRGISSTDQSSWNQLQYPDR